MPDQPLPLYDAARRCPKCGHKGAVEAWRYSLETTPVESNGQPTIAASEMEKRLTDAEHLERTCSLCGYKWAELPLDLAPPKPEPEEVVPAEEPPPVVLTPEQQVAAIERWKDPDARDHVLGPWTPRNTGGREAMASMSPRNNQTQ